MKERGDDKAGERKREGKIKGQEVKERAGFDAGEKQQNIKSDQPVSPNLQLSDRYL